MSKLSDWKFQVVLLYIFFIVGIVGHALDFTYPAMIFLTPYILLISSIWAIHKSLKQKYVVIWTLIAYVITFFLEVLGVAYSLVFGPYYYGNALGPKLLDVPVIIGLNWVIIIFSIVLFSEWFVNKLFKSKLEIKTKTFVIAIFTGIFATFFDFLMEPAAIGLNYWIWTLTEDPFNVPIQNYVAWFSISFLFALTYLLIPEKKRTKLEDSPHSPWFVLVQIIFFIAIRIILFFT